VVEKPAKGGKKTKAKVPKTPSPFLPLFAGMLCSHVLDNNTRGTFAQASVSCPLTPLIAPVWYPYNTIITARNIA
jgi:hypothetical protein